MVPLWWSCCIRLVFPFVIYMDNIASFTHLLSWRASLSWMGMDFLIQDLCVTLWPLNFSFGTFPRVTLRNSWCIFVLRAFFEFLYLFSCYLSLDFLLCFLFSDLFQTCVVFFAYAYSLIQVNIPPTFSFSFISFFWYIFFCLYCLTQSRYLYISLHSAISLIYLMSHNP